MIAAYQGVFGGQQAQFGGPISYNFGLQPTLNQPAAAPMPFNPTSLLVSLTALLLVSSQLGGGFHSFLAGGFGQAQSLGQAAPLAGVNAFSGFGGAVSVNQQPFSMLPAGQASY